MLSNHEPATTLLLTPNEIFLYRVEQLKDETRTDSSINDLACFMEIEQTVTSDMMPKANNFDNTRKNEVFKDKLLKICDDEHKEVRKVLVENGKVAARPV